MTKAPGASGAVIDIDIFRSSRSVALATIVAAPTSALPKLRAGDKIVDSASGEVGMVLKTPEDPRSRIIAGFRYGRRALFRSQLELWDGREGGEVEPPCDVEPEPEAMP